MSDPWEEARMLRRMLADSIELGRRSAVHAAVFGVLLGLVVGWMLGVGGGNP